VLARTGDVAIFVRGGVAYSNGFEFRLALSRRIAPVEFFDPFGRHGRGRGSDDVLRLGVQLASGSKATTVGGWPPQGGGGISSSPTVRFGRG
jgi:hypothetical protein